MRFRCGPKGADEFDGALILLPPFVSRQAREAGGSLVVRDLWPVEA
jgi:hypothetical protein